MKSSTRFDKNSTDPPLSKQASHSIYSILEYEEHQNPNLPINPNSLQYTEKGLNIKLRQFLYFDKNHISISKEFKNNLMVFYIFLSSYLIISFATWVLLYNQGYSNETHLIIRLVWLGIILIISYFLLYKIWKDPKASIHAEYIFLFIGLLILLYLVICDERVLSGITDEDYNRSNQSHVLAIACFFILIRLVTYEKFLILAILSFITLILLLILFLALSPLSVYATLSDFFILLVFLVLQIAETYQSEYRIKQLFWRKTKEEEALNPSKGSLEEDEVKKDNNLPPLNTEIEALVQACDKIKQYIKTASSAIMFKDVKLKLKAAQNELEKIKRTVAHNYIREKWKVDFGEDMDEIDKEFIRQHYMNSAAAHEARASVRKVTMNEINTNEKSSSIPFNESGLKELETIITSVGKNWNFDIWYLYQATGRSISILGPYLFQKWTFNKIFQIKDDTIRVFFEAVENAYINSNPFHNACHASDTLHSMLYFFNFGDILKSLSTLDALSSIIAAFGHDIANPGLTNSFLVSSKDKIALTYNDSSVLQNMHISKIYDILNENEKNILQNLSSDDWMKSRKLIIEMILETDIARHFELLGRFKARVENLGDLSFDNSEDKLSILSMALKSADLGWSAKSTELNERWGSLAMEEFYRQGDLENEKGLPITIFCDRKKSDIPRFHGVFLKVVCLPTYKIWCAFLKSEDLKTTLVNQVKKNLKYWEEKGKFRASLIISDPKIKEAIDNKMSLDLFTEEQFSSAAPDT
ncbi:unnamed protein product [Blepharisma stoltei]|uniref:PDEase domain-containing protein n=1 Tax=Blepharisma stoltei TaxID=1481888 RepID=A0AAU9JYN4_9CILI|nr:unnamed protein product [Blepharisma stoltei]